MLAIRIRKEICELREPRIALFIVIAADGAVAGVGGALWRAGLRLQAKCPGHAADLVFARLNAETNKIERIGQRAHLVKRDGLHVARLNVDVVADWIIERPRRSACGSAGRHGQVRTKPDVERVAQFAADALDKAGFQRGKFSAIECFSHSQALHFFMSLRSNFNDVASLQTAFAQRRSCSRVLP